MRKTRYLGWAGLIVSAGFAYLAVRHVRFADVWPALRSSNDWWLLPAAAMLAVAVFVKALRWRFLFACETRPDTSAVLVALLVGYFANNVLPARAGEAARVLALKRRARTSASEAAATVVLERAYDVLCLLLLLFVAVPWLPPVGWLHAAVVLAVVLLVCLVAAVVALAVWGLRPVHLALRPLRRLPRLSDERVEIVGESLGRGMSALRRPRLVLAALVWTTLSWLALALSMWFAMRGFQLGLPLAAGLLVVIATNLAQILPSSPAAVGVFEAATLVALRSYHVPASEALSYALVVHVLNSLPFIAVGFLILRGAFAGGGAEALLADARLQ